MMSDCLLSISTKYIVLQIMGYLKGKSAIIFVRHSNLKYKFVNRHWN